MFSTAFELTVAGRVVEVRVNEHVGERPAPTAIRTHDGRAWVEAIDVTALKPVATSDDRRS